MNPLDANEGVSSWLWAKFKKHAAFALYDPFVVALAAGTLGFACFEKYIVQDVYYLEKYAEACKLLAEDCEKNNKEEDSIRNIEEEAESAENYSLDFKRKGNIYEKECTPNMVTLKYSNFLLATAAGNVEGGKGLNPVEKTKRPAYTIATMTPCSKLYSFLGKEIHKALESHSDHPYQDWIKLIFPKDHNEGSPMKIEKLLDKLAKPLSREEHEVVGRLYYHALKLDIEFLSAQPLDQTTLVPLLKHGHSANHRYSIVTDFNLCCTVLDSSAVLAEIAILSTLQAKQDGIENRPVHRKSSSDIWTELFKHYSKEHDEWLRKLLPSEKGTVFEYQVLHKFMEELSTIETEANSKLAEARVIRGLNTSDIEKARELNQIIKKLNNSNVDMHIISVRWDGDIIRAFLSGGSDGLHIHSGLSFMESNGIDRHVDTPINKVKIFNNIWISTKEYDMEHTSIYISGDNLGNLLCLLKADIGIVIGTGSNLKRVAEHFGVSFVPLFLGLVEQERARAKCYNGWLRQRAIIYTVSNWSEIHAFLFGSSN